MQKRMLKSLVEWFVLAQVVWCAGCVSGWVGEAQDTHHTAIYEGRARVYESRVGKYASDEMMGRGVGEDAIGTARDMLAGWFVKTGLEPGFVGWRHHGSYVQHFRFDLPAREIRKQLHVAVGDEANQEIDWVAVDMEEFAMMGYGGGGNFEGEVVFAGDGLEEGSVGGALRGKVVVMFYGKNKDGVDGGVRMMRRAAWAKEDGATGVVLVSKPSRSAEGLKKTRETWPIPGLQDGKSGETQLAQAYGDDRKMLPVLMLDYDYFCQVLKDANLGGEGALRRWEARGDELAKKPIVLSGIRMKGRGWIERRAPTLANVAGMLPGRGELAREIVVVGAHYDHLGYGDVHGRTRGEEVFNGADDNASGVVMMEMLAEQMAKREKWSNQRLDNEKRDDRRTVIFVGFNAEEWGLDGSKYFIAHVEDLNVPPGAKVVAMINFDMVGRLRSNRLWLFGEDTWGGWGPLIEEAKVGTGLKVVTYEDPPGGSDHESFVRGGVTGVHLFTGMHGDYHKPTDDVEKVNSVGAMRVMDFADRLIEGVVRYPGRIGFRVAHDGPRTRSEMMSGGYLGVKMREKKAVRSRRAGVLLQEVKVGSPAEKGGMRSGDRILSWDGAAVGSVKRLTYYLSKSRAGEQVELVVLRNEKKISLVVVLGNRKDW
ncbi:M28 family peptidase [Poriferisphaera sp. WC338]|uniref:M28 family peptidase n=1 Tax=Poriferisphaera sp. WC338 TaxID=3425129 RepID=UPI003D816380